MNKTLKSLGRTAAAGSVIMFGLAFLAGCGDETTEVTETIGLGNVAKGEKMPECTADNQGDMIYVVDSAATYFCQDKKWQSLKGEAGEKGDDGKNGENGTSCSAKQTKDKSGYEITCGDKVIGTIKNGEKGEDGNDGDDGASCTAKTLEDGAGIEVSCDGTVIDTLKNGASGKSAFELSGFEGTQAEWLASLKGEAGASCTVAENKAKNGYDVTCGGKTVTVTNGTDGDGKSCKATAVEGGVSIQCGSDEAVVLKNGENGKSAFEIAKENDPTLKTEAEWLASLKGDAGEGCTAEAVEGGVEITCPGSEDAVTITNGTNGTSCTVADNATNSAYVTITCGTTKKDIAKAICSKSAYDPQKKFCYEAGKNSYILASFCGNSGIYDPREKFCDFRNNKLYGYKYYPRDNGARVWAMTENLNYNTDVESYCDNGTSGTTAQKVSTDCSSGNASLYMYHIAMSCDETECGGGHANKTGNAVQGICPTGWKMMSKSVADWLITAKAYDGDDDDENDTFYNETMEKDNGHVASNGKYADNRKFTTFWVTGYEYDEDPDNSKGLTASYSTEGGLQTFFDSAIKSEAYGVRCWRGELPWAYAN